MTTTTDLPRDIITPSDKQHWLHLRTNDITSTEVAALFGISPYTTEYELWHRKRNRDRGEIEANERMVWGNRLETAIADGVAEDLGIDVEPMKQYISIPKLRIGSSFDFRILDDPEGILEVKNVDSLVFRDQWLDDDGNPEAPPHIELQFQHELLVSGARWGYIAALVGGNRVVTIKREADDAIHRAIVAKCDAFWKSIESGTEPTPDYGRDVDTIARLYGHAEPGKLYDGKGDERIAGLCREYYEAGQAEKSAKARKDAAKAELLTIIGNAEKCLTDLGSISAGVVGEAEISYTRKPYRAFRFTMSKAAKEAMDEKAA